MKRQKRRRSREEEAHKLHEINRSSDSDIDWERARPVLDDAISELKEMDRSAVWLRYFEERSFTDIGKRLQLSEDAARMRVKRALDKLGALVARRGITSSSSAALAVAVGGQASTAAPAGMSSVLSNVAVAGVAAGTGYLGIASILAVMNTTKGISAAVVLAAALGLVAYLNPGSTEEKNESGSSESLNTKSTSNVEIARDTEPSRVSVALSEDERFEEYRKRLEPIVKHIVENAGTSALDPRSFSQLSAFLIEVFDSGDHRIAYRLANMLPNHKALRGRVLRFMQQVADRLDPEEIEGILRDVDLSPTFGGQIAYGIIESLSKEIPIEAAAWAKTLPESYIGPTLGHIVSDLQKPNAVYGYEELDWFIRSEAWRILERLDVSLGVDGDVAFALLESLNKEHPRDVAARAIKLPNAYAGVTLGYVFGDWRSKDPEFGYEALDMLSAMDDSVNIVLPLMQVAMSFKDDPAQLIEIVEGIDVRGELFMNMVYASTAAEFLDEGFYEECLLVANLVSERDPRGKRLVEEALQMLKAEEN